MTDTKISRRDGMRGMMALGAASAVAAVAGTALTAAPAEAAQIHMDAALATLRIALHQLNDAMDDKGGFRVKAIGHCSDAIADCVAGIEYARTH